MDSALTFAVAALGVYYLALSATKQEGPFELFGRLRNLFTENDWKGRGIRCHVCVSLYAALLVTIGLWGLGHINGWDGPLVWLGLAGASVMLDKYWSR